MKNVSVIITTYNAQKTVKRAIFSVLKTINQSKIEILIVDDCSSDDTVSIVEDIARDHKNIKIIKLKKNSGTPSKPRNIGIEAAKGKYITFLDDDDEINGFNLLEMVNHANMHNLDCIKGYLKVVKGNEIVDMDKIECDNNNSINVMKNIISGQSTRIDIIIKRDFIIENHIRFNENYKIGEDTLFYADLFMCKPKIEYYNSFICYHHKGNDITNLSSTQNYQDKELNDHLSVWELTEKKLKTIDISYYELRLPVAVKNNISSIIFYSNGKISEQSFNRLSEFLNENVNYLKNKLILHERYNLIYNSILDNDYEEFLNLSKKRLLVAGYDLKFIKPVLKYFKDDYNIKIDKWTGHNIHDENKSVELLNWADFIFCEWLLGNSVWYSKRKMRHQKLIIRAHRFELNRDFGNQVNYSKVNGVISVSYYYLELFATTFNIPREKMFLLSNYIQTNIFTGIKNEGFKHNLAIVGYVPKLKGLFKGLKILKMLKEEDKKFKLYLIGKNYEEIDWIWNNPEERSYFQECETFIKENHLKDSIVITGCMERSEIFTNIGYVLSLSDIESFHLAPAEGIVDLTLAFLLNWDGVEYVYPQEIIFDNINDIKDMILLTHNNDYEYYQLLKKMRDYVMKEYNLDNFVFELKQILKRVSLN